MGGINAPAQKNDDMDIIFRGISAARDIYGIMQDRKLANDKALLAKANEAKQADKEAAIAAEAQRKAGAVMNEGEELALYRSGKVQPAPDDAKPGDGFIKLGYRQADGRPILGRVKDEISKPPALGEAIAQERLGLAKKQEARAAAKFNKEQARTANGQPLSPAEITAHAAGSSAFAAIDRLGEKIDTHADSMGWASGRAHQLKGAIFKNDMPTADFDVPARAVAMSIAKYSQSGVLSDQDVKYAIEGLPTLADDPEIARKKLNNVKQLLIDKQMAHVAMLKQQGYDVSGIKALGEPAATAEEKKAEKKTAGILDISTPAMATPTAPFNPAGYINKGR